MLLLKVVGTFRREDSDVPYGAYHNMATDIKRRSQLGRNGNMKDAKQHEAYLGCFLIWNLKEHRKPLANKDVVP